MSEMAIYVLNCKFISRALDLLVLCGICGMQEYTNILANDLYRLIKWAIYTNGLWPIV